MTNEKVRLLTPVTFNAGANLDYTLIAGTVVDVDPLNVEGGTVRVEFTGDRATVSECDVEAVEFDASTGRYERL